MMALRLRWLKLSGALLSYVALSSVLGMGMFLFVASPALLWLFWTGSILASLVFAGGSAVVGWGAFELGRAKRWWSSLMVGMGGTWLIYVLSFWILVHTQSAKLSELVAGPDPILGPGLIDLVVEILSVGWAGILFAGLTPALAAWWTSEESGQL